MSGTAWVTGVTATPPDPEYGPATAGQADPDVLVNDFLARASPGAERLAHVLASAAELSMPLIYVLQERLAPTTGVTELAEVLASGLLENSPAVHSSRGSGSTRECRRSCNAEPPPSRSGTPTTRSAVTSTASSWAARSVPWSPTPPGLPCWTLRASHSPASSGAWPRASACSPPLPRHRQLSQNQ